jgi:hypothetical protein
MSFLPGSSFEERYINRDRYQRSVTEAAPRLVRPTFALNFRSSVEAVFAAHASGQVHRASLFFQQVKMMAALETLDD